MSDKQWRANHEEAFELASMRADTSNLARCYLELGIERDRYREALALIACRVLGGSTSDWICSTNLQQIARDALSPNECAHEGSCTPESGCDASCMDAATEAFNGAMDASEALPPSTELTTHKE